ncbi:MAG TPA: MarR family transcriptional regulator [Verrucomicrobiae bacterium]|nr:MarR family transcriptional regulator [Verrucomicrobiae bacterium]
MSHRIDLEQRVFAATREQGMASVLLRNAVSRKLGLNITDMECLSLLAIRGSSSPTELARYTGMTPGSATVMLDRLERANLIRRKPNPNDRRGVLIEINERSNARAGQMFAGAQKALVELIASYSDSELETIADFLKRFTDDIKRNTVLI